jgi:hypothetical protein
MNLARHAAVLWRFRIVTVTGLTLGLVLAVLASYKVSFDGGPSLQARGKSTFNSESQILVTQAGFPEGRVTLPDAPILGSDGKNEDPQVDPDRIEYGDPGRFMALADLYTQLLTSDRVRSRMPEKPKVTQITASPLPATSGAPILPIISLITTAETAEGANALNTHSYEALRDLLKEEQSKADILPAQRIQLKVLKAPTKGQLVAGPSRTGSILAMILAIIGTIAATHILAAIRGVPGAPVRAERDDDEIDDEREPIHPPRAEPQPATRLTAVGGNRTSGPGYWGAR